MYKFMNNPYMHGPYKEADKGGGAGGSGADDGADDAGGDDQDDDESDEGGGEQDEKKYSQKDIDEAVKKRLARENGNGSVNSRRADLLVDSIKRISLRTMPGTPKLIKKPERLKKRRQPWK